MRDSCGRTIDYLRLSVTDLCNYRCQYCMPPEGVEKRLHSDILSIEELAEIAAAAGSVRGKEDPPHRRGASGAAGIARTCADAAGHPRVGGAVPHYQRLPPAPAGKAPAGCGGGPAEHQPGYAAAGPVRRHDPAGDPPGRACGIKARRRLDSRNLKFDTVLSGGFTTMRSKIL